jgi:endonuclease/exonuclease/phosphatase (EEP) superfamily protein YafD
MAWLALVLAVVLTVASLLPVLRREAWWIRVFDFPRAQILGAGIAVVLLLLLSGEVGTGPGLAALLALAPVLVIQAARIYPYTPWAPQEVLFAEDCEGPSLALLVANVLMENRQERRLLELVAQYQPDVLLLLEPDGWWEEKLRALAADYPYAIRQPLDNKYGMLLYSHLPLLEPEVKYLVRTGIPSMHARVRLNSGELIRLHALHPEPPSPTEADTSLPRDVELLVVGREVSARAEASIVAGDLNDVAWSYTTTLFQKTSGLLDPRKGRGMFNTFHAKIPFMRWPLDHVFHSRDFVLCDMQRLPAFGSDHFPVYVRLAYRPGAAARQAGPAVNAMDAETVRAKLGKVERQKSPE